MIYWFRRNNRAAGWLTSYSQGMEVVLMIMFSFGDLVAFGMLIIALLTFIFTFR